MREQLIVFIVVAPLMASLVAPFFAYLSAKAVRGFSILAVLVALVSSIGALSDALTYGTSRYFFGGYIPPLGIEYIIDPLSGSMTVLISLISLIVLIYSGPFFAHEKWLKQGVFYGLYLLITAGLLGMVSTGDVFNLYVFLEISSIATYGLIAAGGFKASVAAFKYLILGTVGASFYLLGVGYLYAVTGTLNMMELVERVQPMVDSPAVLIAVALMVVGLGIKMALFPLHGWLPDAYTYAPSPVTAFMSGVATKVSAYVMFRIFFYIIGAMSGPIPQVLTVLGWLASIGIIIGSIMAIAQSDFRRMLAYSSVAQIGYIILGLAIGNTLALIGAVLHIINHAVMKSCMFLIAGGINYKTGEYSIEEFMELHKKMPVTMGAFIIAALSMIGIPPMAGFFSKWYLVLGAIEANIWPYVAVIVLSSLLNLVYFFRVIENIYLKKRQDGSPAPRKGLELPLTMLIPIVVLSIGIIVIGLFNEQIVTQVLQFAVPGGGYTW